MSKPIRVLAVVAVAALGLAACGGGSDNESGADAENTLVISTDLPLQGAAGDASADTNAMIELYLESVGYKAGDRTIALEKYDNSTTAKGGWDDATCSANAQKHVTAETEVAVMGMFNSGCTKLQLP